MGKPSARHLGTHHAFSFVCPLKGAIALGNVECVTHLTIVCVAERYGMLRRMVAETVAGMVAW